MPSYRRASALLRLLIYDAADVTTLGPTGYPASSSSLLTPTVVWRCRPRKRQFRGGVLVVSEIQRLARAEGIEIEPLLALRGLRSRADALAVHGLPPPSPRAAAPAPPPP
eukprot:CAMPEP_0170196296 /NCGR_PEP_ID=MMETSP0040_2-20121228/63553_1 /TAXON_ID=641309 /ORGANISM="Lotharella oceanica, Strain CCMP622" /LENGTH=109 /DNA_ID=CAMNT_0010445671 /DNA_START=59 /DNA_END=386 /DNA_ORIENTATION=+